MGEWWESEGQSYCRRCCAEGCASTRTRVGTVRASSRSIWCAAGSNVIRLAWSSLRGGASANRAANQADVTVSERCHPSVVSQPLILAT
jgi:hypothetical protein